MNSVKIERNAKPKPRLFYGYIVVAIAFLIMLLNFGTRSSFGVFFNPMISEFSWTRALTSGALTLSMLIQGVVAIIMGRLNDRFGPRPVMTLCCFFLGLGYVLMSLMSGASQLYFFYGVIIGIGMSSTYVVTLSTVARWFVRRRGIMTGIVISGLNVGTIIMPPLSDWIIYNYDWRIAYIILGGLVLVIGIIAAQFLKRDPAQKGLLPYGATGIYEEGIKLKEAGYSLRDAIYTRQFWLICGFIFCVGFTLRTILVHIVPHAIDLDISTRTAVYVLTIIGATSIVGNIFASMASDRIGFRATYIISFILIAISFGGLIFASHSWQIFIIAVIFGLGTGGCTPLGSPLIASLYGLRSHGLIFGSISWVYTIGAAIGPFIAGYLFDVSGNYQSAFFICGLFGIIGLTLSALLIPPARKYS